MVDARANAMRVCEELAAQKLGDGAVVQTSMADGCWCADASSTTWNLGVYGFDSEEDALRALAAVLEKEPAHA